MSQVCAPSSAVVKSRGSLTPRPSVTMEITSCQDGWRITGAMEGPVTLRRDRKEPITVVVRKGRGKEGTNQSDDRERENRGEGTRSGRG